MPRKRKVSLSLPQPTYVNFDFEDRTYQIDPDAKKVYRRFVEIETSRASQILSIWRSGEVTV